MASLLLLALLMVFLIIIIILVYLIIYCKEDAKIVISNSKSYGSFQNELFKLHQFSPKRTSNYCVLKQGFSEKSQSFFSWADHPNLIADAVENGWSGFAFRAPTSSASVEPLLGSDSGDEVSNVEIDWGAHEGSGDYVMQKIRFNQGLEKVIDLPTGAMSVIRTGLPLPGPRFGNSYFPQEAYFEITILPRVEEVKNGGEGDGKTEVIWMSVGLTGKGGSPSNIPGRFQGSVGFNSDGSVYLNGTKLMFESANDEWPQEIEKVIGCGYNPSKKTVFFTADSQLVHEIHCKTEEFGHPLYPMLAANVDIMILFNLGQSPFKFEPGNIQRTPNPCLIGPAGQPNSSALGYITEDNNDLFSLGRVDSQWLQRNVKINYNTVNSFMSLEFDPESESELFEIVLDNMRRSPYSTRS